MLQSYGYGPTSSSSVPNTYLVAFAITTAASGVFLEFYGSASRTVKIIEIYVFKPSSSTTIAFQKRSTASTGGTSTTITPMPLNASNAAATAAVKEYSSAVPTPGTLVNTIFTGTVTPGDILGFTFGDIGDQPITLNSATQGVTLTASAGSITVNGYVKFTEE